LRKAEVTRSALVRAILQMIKFLEKHKVVAIILTILIAVEIFYFSAKTAVPGAELSSLINPAIIYHTIVFFLFTFFLTASIKNKNEILKPKQIILIFTISLIYAISDEVHQLFVPGRVASIKDVLIDLFGVLLALLIYPKKKFQ